MSRVIFTDWIPDLIFCLVVICYCNKKANLIYVGLQSPIYWVNSLICCIPGSIEYQMSLKCTLLPLLSASLSLKLCFPFYFHKICFFSKLFIYLFFSVILISLFVTLTLFITHIYHDFVSRSHCQVLLQPTDSPLKDRVGPLLAVAHIVADYDAYRSALLKCFD